MIGCRKRVDKFKNYSLHSRYKVKKNLTYISKLINSYLEFRVNYGSLNSNYNCNFILTLK